MRGAPTLQRRLSRLDGLAIGVGSVIRVGVFRTSGQVLRGAGGVAGSAAVWLALGATSLLGAFVYAGAADRVPEAGGPYAYVREAFGRHAAFADGWLAAAVSIPARQAAGLAAIGEIAGGALGLPRAWAALEATLRGRCQRGADVAGALPGATKARLEFVSEGRRFAPAPAARRLRDAWAADAPDALQLKGAAPPAFAA